MTSDFSNLTAWQFAIAMRQIMASARFAGDTSFNLVLIFVILGPLIGFVNMSANWSVDGVYSILNNLSLKLLRTLWYMISMCFDVFKDEFDLIRSIADMSIYIVGISTLIEISLINCRSQRSLLEVSFAGIYSASVLDCAMAICFLEKYATGAPAINRNPPDVDDLFV